MTRRDLLVSAAAALPVTAFPIAARAADAAPSGPPIKVGFVGCGGRGSFVAEIFKEDGGFEFAGAADYFQDRADAFGDKFGVPAGKRFSGLGGVKKLLDSGIDVLAIHSPPYFHPEHTAAALNAGKHVFLAKPVAVDVPGSLSIEELGKSATEKKLVFLVDFQSRGNAVFTEALTRVRSGRGFGKLTYGESIYEYGTLGAQVPEEKTAEDRLKNWVQHRSLSGDIIVEQNIHALDIVAWAFGPALRATGTGARSVKTGPGDTCDHFNVLYEYKDGGSISFLSRQYSAWGASPFTIKNRFFGTKGALETDFGGMVHLRSEAAESYRGKSEGLYKEGSVQQVKAFRTAIHGGDFSNPTVGPAVETNLVCLFGRLAAEKRRTVTWEELLADTRRETPDLTGLKD
jgi:myo-inositol 2-dehydrogenase / D-chiro-inositol 1-dehydrogenase